MFVTVCVCVNVVCVCVAQGIDVIDDNVHYLRHCGIHDIGLKGFTCNALNIPLFYLSQS